MITKASPSYLPQISAPYSMVLDRLNDENINYELITIDPNILNPSQSIVFSDDIDNVISNDENPIWIDIDNNICDGHHRTCRSLIDNKKQKAIKVFLNFKNACRILNKIQDIIDYENAKGIEEVEAQDAINQENQIDSNINDNDFLTSLEEYNLNYNIENNNDNIKNNQIYVAYRKEPINDNSVVGNFFILNPINGFTKYEIEFDNILDTDNLGIDYKDSQNPIEILSKLWFPHINFESISKQYNISSERLKSKAIAESAIKRGYDGIKYGKKIIQGLK